MNVPGQGQQTFATVAAVNTYLATGNAGSYLHRPAGRRRADRREPDHDRRAVHRDQHRERHDHDQPHAGHHAADRRAARRRRPRRASSDSSTTRSTNDAHIDVQKIAVVGGTPAAPTDHLHRALQQRRRARRDAGRAQRPARGRRHHRRGLDLHRPSAAVPGRHEPDAQRRRRSFVTQPAGATFIYSTDGVTWTTSTAGAVYVGVFVPSAALHSQGGASFGTNPGSAQNSVTAGQASLAFTFVVNGSTAGGVGERERDDQRRELAVRRQRRLHRRPRPSRRSRPRTRGNPGTAASSTAIGNANGNLTGSGFINSAGGAGQLRRASTARTASRRRPARRPTTTTTPPPRTSRRRTTPRRTRPARRSRSRARRRRSSFTNIAQNTSNQVDTFNLTTVALAADLSGTALPAGWTVTFKSTGQAASGGCCGGRRRHGDHFGLRAVAARRRRTNGR